MDFVLFGGTGDYDLLELFATIQYTTNPEIFTTTTIMSSEPKDSQLVFNADSQLVFNAKDDTDQEIQFKLSFLDAIRNIDSFLNPYDSDWKPWKSEDNIPERRMILFRLVLSDIDLFKYAINNKIWYQREIRISLVFRYITNLEIKEDDYLKISRLYSYCDKVTKNNFKYNIQEQYNEKLKELTEVEKTNRMNYEIIIQKINEKGGNVKYIRSLLYNKAYEELLHYITLTRGDVDTFKWILSSIEKNNKTISKTTIELSSLLSIETQINRRE